VQQLANVGTFHAFSVSNSERTQLDVSSNLSATPGTYDFQAIREASTHSLLSKGYANADTQSLGVGTLTIANGGGLHRSTLLDALNGGNGVQRGLLRTTDRDGNSADIDLSNAHSVDDVLDAINANEDVSVTATTSDGQIVITDTSGGTASNLIVSEVGDGKTATDLGINKSVASAVLNGDAVFEITGDFTLDQINDGNGLRLLEGAPDIQITLTDDTVLEINLDGIDKINNHEDNAGKVSASLNAGRLELKDLSGGGGSSSFTVQNINDTSVVRQLGLDVAAVGSTISGRRLAAGINSVLLSNLRGGRGIDELGQLTLTDRASVTATINLGGAESLDDVTDAINAAESLSSVKLQLSARINAAGTGI